jgi:hypothetical protein
MTRSRRVEMTGKAIALVAIGVIALGGVGSALGDLGEDDSEAQLSELELRKDDSSDDVELVDDDQDDGDGNSQNPETQSGENTGGTADTRGTGADGDTGDGDATAGNDGTGGGDNSYVAPAEDSYVAPAPAPAPAYEYDGGSDDGGSDG